ncbi:MAG: Copper/silver-translocating P-type ATPase [Candidatus Curtissbacteria bacterium GW2011_GWA1_40_16]|uniref:Copper/silver-translocating P-type ATPase n=1 Tax=Candidatus Curtissbacteria bacterium GW2011_GWA1_40_16 TaxID=1618405 RepID=A0A0G0TW77_9BACT|nr:MAG: Copper/silver-translocating P-type ATPase [Candidatus Curtissbacteria bacterium GW2011_GWA1_40_16]
MSKIVKKKLKISGMHCTSCAMKIDMDLEDLEGIKEARTSFAKQESEVEFDQDKLDIQNVIAVIEKTGYSAQIKAD